MSLPQNPILNYSIVQYIPDFLRGENHNVGVLFYGQGFERFYALGMVTGDLVDTELFESLCKESKGQGWAYREWISWFRMLVKRRGKEPEGILLSLKRLDEHCKHFVARDHGEIELGPNDKPDQVAEAFFSQVVNRSTAKRSRSFNELISATLGAIGLHERADFKRDIEIEFTPPGKLPLRIKLFCVLLNEPRTVIKVVRFRTSHSAFLQQVNDAAFTFEKMVEFGFVGKERCIVLTESPTLEKQDRIKHLAGLAHIIDVTKPDAAAKINAIITG